MAKHKFSIHSFLSPTWCDECSGFLVGLRRQGYQCKGCERDICKKCHKDEKVTNGTCKGKEGEKEHTKKHVKAKDDDDKQSAQEDGAPDVAELKRDHARRDMKPQPGKMQAEVANLASLPPKVIEELEGKVLRRLKPFKHDKYHIPVVTGAAVVDCIIRLLPEANTRLAASTVAQTLQTNSVIIDARGPLHQDFVDAEYSFYFLRTDAQEEEKMRTKYMKPIVAFAQEHMAAVQRLGMELYRLRKLSTTLKGSELKEWMMSELTSDEAWQDKKKGGIPWNSADAEHLLQFFMDLERIVPIDDDDDSFNFDTQKSYAVTDHIRFETQLLKYRTHTASVGAAMASEGYEPRHPVLLVPGLAGTALGVWKSELMPSWEGTRIWVDGNKFAGVGVKQVLSSVLGGRDDSMRRFLYHMGMGEDCYSDPPGVKVRPLEGLSAVDALSHNSFLAPAMTVYSKIIRNLVEIGYEQKNLDALPYDWRVPLVTLHERDGLLCKVQSKIEHLYHANGDAPVVVIAHSMGNRVLQLFYAWMKEKDGGQEWIDKHVHKHIAMGAPFLGAVKAVRMLLAGFAFSSSLEWLLSASDIRDISRRLGSLPALFPLQHQLHPQPICFLRSEGGPERLSQDSLIGVHGTPPRTPVRNEKDYAVTTWEEYQSGLFADKVTQGAIDAFQARFAKHVPVDPVEWSQDEHVVWAILDEKVERLWSYDPTRSDRLTDFRALSSKYVSSTTMTVLEEEWNESLLQVKIVPRGIKVKARVNKRVTSRELLFFHEVSQWDCPFAGTVPMISFFQQHGRMLVSLGDTPNGVLCVVTRHSPEERMLMRTIMFSENDGDKVTVANLYYEAVHADMLQASAMGLRETMVLDEDPAERFWRMARSHELEDDALQPYMIMWEQHRADVDLLDDEEGMEISPELLSGIFEVDADRSESAASALEQLEVVDRKMKVALMFDDMRSTLKLSATQYGVKMQRVLSSSVISEHQCAVGRVYVRADPILGPCRCAAFLAPNNRTLVIMERSSKLVTMKEYTFTNQNNLHVTTTFLPRDNMTKQEDKAEEPLTVMEVVSRMKSANGVEVKDRKWHLKSYPSCFVGNELVDWLVVEKLALGPVEAVAVGQELVKLGVFHHVTKDHPFKNERLFYTFTNTVEIPSNLLWGEFVKREVPSTPARLSVSSMSLDIKGVVSIDQYFLRSSAKAPQFGNLQSTDGERYLSVSSFLLMRDLLPRMWAAFKSHYVDQQHWLNGNFGTGEPDVDGALRGEDSLMQSELNFEAGLDPVADHDAHSPAIAGLPVRRLLCAYGINRKTAVSLYFKATKGGRDVVVDESASVYSHRISSSNPAGLMIKEGIGFETRTTPQPVVGHRPRSGDGTVPYCSLAYPRVWREHNQAHGVRDREIELIELEGSHHQKMLHEDSVSYLLIQQVAKKKGDQ